MSCKACKCWRIHPLRRPSVEPSASACSCPPGSCSACPSVRRQGAGQAGLQRFHQGSVQRDRGRPARRLLGSTTGERPLTWNRRACARRSASLSVGRPWKCKPRDHVRRRRLGDRHRHSRTTRQGVDLPDHGRPPGRWSGSSLTATSCCPTRRTSPPAPGQPHHGISRE